MDNMLGRMQGIAVKTRMPEKRLFPPSNMGTDA